MTEQKFLRPAERVKVRRPDGRHLADKGESVTMDTYWQRRLSAGDVVEVAETAHAATAKGTGNGRTKGTGE